MPATYSRRSELSDVMTRCVSRFGNSPVSDGPGTMAACMVCVKYPRQVFIRRLTVRLGEVANLLDSPPGECNQVCRYIPASDDLGDGETEFAGAYQRGDRLVLESSASHAKYCSVK